MNIRELVEALVDADVETGAMTPVMVRDGSTLYSVKAVVIEPGAEFEGTRDHGPTIWIDVEEY